MVREKKKKEFFRTRPRIKGKIKEKKTTKKGNITLTIQKGEKEVSFTILKSHKERFALAEKLAVGNTVSAVGIPKFRINICTQLKPLMKETDNSRQMKLG
jgi:hypothetical protein